MQNLRQRFKGFIVAGVLAAILGGATPAYAEVAQIGGAGKNTCAFVAGMLLKVPADSGAAAVFNALLIAFEC